MKWARTGIIVVVAVVVVGAIVWGFLPEAVLVDTAPAIRGPLEVTVREEGRTRVMERYVLSAPVSGYLRRVDLDVGDPVRKGQALVRLEPSPAEMLDPRTHAQAQARVSAAEASLGAAREDAAAAEADASLADAQLERLRELHERGAISASELDRAEADASAARARYEAAQRAVDVAGHELEAARTALRYTGAESGAAGDQVVPVSAPIDGRVLQLMRESEGPITLGAPIVEVGDPGHLEVEVEVLSDDAVRIEPGMRVRLERWGGEGDLEAVVRRIEPVGFTDVSALGVEEQRVLVIVDLTSPRERWQRLGDGYRVEAVFVLWRGDDVLQVPTSALFRRDDSWATFVVVDGSAELRQVGVGHRAGLQTEITEGLSAGDRVVVHPPDELEDGSDVRLDGDQDS